MKVEDLRFPHRHWQILESFEEIGSESKRQKWLKCSTGPQDFDTFEETMNFVADYGIFMDDAHRLIGESLRNEYEARTIEAFKVECQKVDDDVGRGQPAARYLDHPHWPVVMAAARKLAKMMRAWFAD